MRYKKTNSKSNKFYLFKLFKENIEKHCNILCIFVNHSVNKKCTVLKGKSFFL